MTAIRRPAAAFVLWMASILPAFAGVPVPQVSGADLYELAIPEAPFAANADADRDIDRAFAQARAENKRVLIDLGANWCADCRILAGLMELPEVRRFVEAHFVVVNVDVGRFNRNLDIPARFGITERLHAVPGILITSSDGTLLNGGQAMVLVNASRMDPQAVVNWLAYWAR